MTTNTNGQLQSFIDRLERLQTEKDAISEDLREVMAEAKSSGFDPKIIRQVLKLRKMDAAERQEQEALLTAYEAALGMIADLPLGRAAMRAAEKPEQGDGRVDKDVADVALVRQKLEILDALTSDSSDGKLIDPRALPKTTAPPIPRTPAESAAALKRELAGVAG
jgi:uncharacterized protein (UPF0335 family)